MSRGDLKAPQTSDSLVSRTPFAVGISVLVCPDTQLEQKSPKELVAEVETGQVSLGNQHKTHLLPALTLCK